MRHTGASPLSPKKEFDFDFQTNRRINIRLATAVIYIYNCYRIGTVIIVCGGQGPQEDITEALAMERYLVKKGIPQSKIIKEEESTSTHENFPFARNVLAPHFPQGFSAVLITNDFHIYRASKFAGYAGIPANLLGAPTVWYTIPVSYLREMLAVVKIWVMPPPRPSAKISQV